jgi:hypothetical protein
MENEIMRLQEVLKEREAEISLLETSLNDKSAVITITQELANGDAPPVSYLSPNTLDQFNDLRRTMVNSHGLPENSSERSGSISEPDESLDRLNELMLCVLSISNSSS